jgi:hypothetical protein
VPNTNATRVATIAGDPTRVCLYSYDKGSVMLNGFVAPEKRILLFLQDDTFTGLNADGIKLFEAAVNYALAAGATPVFRPAKLTVSRNGASLQISWTESGTLQFADKVTGPWNDLAVASPKVVPIDSTMKFYRVVGK